MSATVAPAPTADAIGERWWWSVLLGSKVTLTGMLLVALLAVTAIAGPWLVPQDPLSQSFLDASQGPSAEHWFGTDTYGRDVFARVVVGTRASLVIGLTGPLVAAFLGVWTGMLAAWFGGWTDRLLSRFSDLLMSFPTLLLGVMIAAALGPGFRTAVVAVAVALYPRFMRLARSASLVVIREPYVDASITAGRGVFGILRRHVAPNIAGPLIVALSLWIATAIRLEAALSFLGLGTQPPAPSWGNMIRDGMTDLIGAPWSATFAGLAITVAVLAFNMTGDALRDLLDPEFDA
jgi:peptide/nickel transport system permease protein